MQPRQWTERTRIRRNNALSLIYRTPAMHIYRHSDRAGRQRDKYSCLFPRADRQIPFSAKIKPEASFHRDELYLRHRYPGRCSHGSWWPEPRVPPVGSHQHPSYSVTGSSCFLAGLQTPPISPISCMRVQMCRIFRFPTARKGEYLARHPNPLWPCHAGPILHLTTVSLSNSETT